MLRTKYQAKSIKDLIGQKIVKRIFNRILEIKEDNQGHSVIYPTLLLSGIRGLGKTLSSRLFAQTINCTNKIDVYTPCHLCNSCQSIKNNTNQDFVEIDAATYNGVDNIRSAIVEHSKYSPTQLKHRVYLIDEAHMLTRESFNALLKTIEYPPERVVFLLATTELEKIPDTVRSRCLTLDFIPINIEELLEYSKEILMKEQYDMDDDAILCICNISAGSVRDLLVLLEKAILCSVKDMTQCLNVFGCCGYNTIMDIYFLILGGKRDEAINEWGKLQEAGCSQEFFVQSLLNIVSDCLVFRNNPYSQSEKSFYNISNEIKLVDNNYLAKHWEIVLYMYEMRANFAYNKNWVRLTIIFLCHMTYTVGDEGKLDFLLRFFPLGHLKNRIWSKN